MNLQVNYTRLEQVMTAKKEYEELMHQIAYKDTPSQRIAFINMLLKLKCDELSDKQIDDLKHNIKLAQMQEVQYEK